MVSEVRLDFNFSAIHSHVWLISKLRKGSLKLKEKKIFVITF